MDHASRRLAQALPLAICPIALLAPGISRGAPDTFNARVATLASLETLNAEILASRSATATLEAWCAVHAMASEPKIKAELVRGADKLADEAQRKRLGVSASEPIKYRHVRLTCGPHVLSEADNWYVPSRLTPEMNHLLETTDTPFGKAVSPLKPTRETFAVQMVWKPLPDGWEIHSPPADHPETELELPPILFEHRAVLFDADHRPFSEVDEHYTRDLLAFAP